MISYDEELLEARRKAAEENPQMNYAAWARYYSDSEGLTEYELSILKDSISEHREEVREFVSEVTGRSEEEIEKAAEEIEF